MRPVLITSSIVLALVIGLRADDPTSRYVPLTSVASTLPPSSSGLTVQFEVWDSAVLAPRLGDWQQSTEF